jgi:hypothetical protein
MGWNLDEIGFKDGEKIVHVVEAVVHDGEPDYEPYSDEFLKLDEWQKLSKMGNFIEFNALR